MSLDLRVSQVIPGPPTAVWEVLVDWVGQRRWIPFTTVRVVGDQTSGLGVRCVALSGWWLGRIPVGLLDRFVVTAWRPPAGTELGLLEVLHLGPYFTGPGAFELVPTTQGTEVRCTEIVDIAGGRLVTKLAGLLTPLMRIGFVSSLRALGRLAEQTQSR